MICSSLNLRIACIFQEKVLSAILVEEVTPMFHFLQKINSQLQKLRVMFFDNLPTTMLEEVGHFIYVLTYYEVYRKKFKVNFQ